MFKEKLQPLTGDGSPREMLSAKVFDAAISALGDTLNLSAADEAVTVHNRLCQSHRLSPLSHCIFHSSPN